MKRALIFSPYLDSIGGGEVYTLHFALGLEKLGYAIDLAWEDKTTLKKLSSTLGLKLSKFKLNSTAYQNFRNRQNLWQRFTMTSEYDLIFFLSDGSVPFLFAKKNILHFQVPFTHLQPSWLNYLKLKNQTIVCNSIFTQKIISQHLGKKANVIYPPVKLRQSMTKQKLILSVGRFTDKLHNKRQDLLIEAFKNLYDQGYDQWRLILVGNDIEGKQIVAKLKKLIKAYPVEIITSADYEQLNKLYGISSIYWHAAGFGIDELKQPEKVEHFGISTVEAMSAGCVPVVISKGGQKEIVDHNLNGFLFDTKQQLIAYTAQLIDQPKTRNQLARAAEFKSQQFGLDKFYQQISELV